jgi:hypothetical protein
VALTEPEFLALTQSAVFPRGPGAARVDVDPAEFHPHPGDPLGRLLAGLTAIFSGIAAGLPDRAEHRARLAAHQLRLLVERDRARRRGCVAGLRAVFREVLRRAAPDRADRALRVAALRSVFSEIDAALLDADPPPPQEELARATDLWLWEMKYEAQCRQRLAQETRDAERELRDHLDLLATIVQSMRQYHLFREEDKAERKNLRVCADLEFAVDEAVRELKPR